MMGSQQATLGRALNVVEMSDGVPSAKFAVVFEFGSAELTEESVILLARVAQVIQSEADLLASTFLIDGHTDSVGSEEANQALGLARAQSVAAYLQTQLETEMSFKVRSFGETRLFDVSSPGSGVNRRVELTPVVSDMVGTDYDAPEADPMPEYPAAQTGDPGAQEAVHEAEKTLTLDLQTENVVGFDLQVNFLERLLVPAGSTMSLKLTAADAAVTHSLVTQNGPPYDVRLPVPEDFAFPAILDVILTSLDGHTLAGSLDLSERPSEPVEINIQVQDE
ncbi:hypothetical protein AVJ23_15895 [Pseudoponticoccus marisrubri]|uniref:OmpA-like domain-containing protein n=2 Tax=Pseudoponticoccus marisrubri TaxID=1685382 RepID=A0A0W7WGB7_9RHOB|nr:hypothetical protein AVJ23_15895 [Pseudoponticoccus marisrubri]